MKNFLLIYILVPLLMLTACGPSKSNEPAPPPVEGSRSVLVYISANNTLGRDRHDTDDIDEMLAAARQGDFGESRLIVYHHARLADPQLKEITPEGIKVLKTYNTSLYSSDSRRMTQVIEDFKKFAPAERYGLILWSHGSGWIQNGMEAPKENVISPLSFGQDGMKKDPDGSHWMNVTTLAETLEGKGFDYVYFDCCYMGGIEVVYQMRHVAPYIVASVTELPAPGMPYDLSLKHLMKSDADLIAAAETTFDFYDSKSGDARTCTMSVIRTDGLDELADLTRQIYSHRHALPSGFSPLRFSIDYPCYYHDFKQCVEARTVDWDLYERWEVAFDSVVVFNRATPMLWAYLSLNGCSGLSNYLVRNESDAFTELNYYQLDWWKDVVSVLFVDNKNT